MRTGPDTAADAGPAAGWPARAIERLRRSPVAFPLALLSAAAMLAISELGYRQTCDELNGLMQLGTDRIELMQVGRLITDAETSQRGYLLTGQPDELQPFYQARRELMLHQQALEADYRTRGQAASVEGVLRLQQLTHDKFVEMQRAIDLHDAGRSGAAALLIQRDHGGARMRAIGAETDRLMAIEDQTIASKLTSVYDTLMLHRIGVAAMSPISLLVLGMYLRQRQLNDRQQDAQQQLIQDEQRRLEQEVQLRTRELTALTRHLETAREDERAHLARELHDELGALLTAAKLDVARIRPHLQHSLPELMPRLAHLVETLNSGIALKRRIIEDLLPSTLSNLGLKPALEILCREFADRSALPVEAEIEALPLSPAAELTVFRVVQESLTNIGKYAAASRVRVRLRLEDDRAHLQVQDDGIGFDAGLVGLKKHGLVGMRYRVQAEQGRLVVDSEPGRGTTVQAWLQMQA